jgi:hypothetical protein
VEKEKKEKKERRNNTTILRQQTHFPPSSLTSASSVNPDTASSINPDTESTFLPLSTAGTDAAVGVAGMAGVADEGEVLVSLAVGIAAEGEPISEDFRESNFTKGDEGLVRSGITSPPPPLPLLVFELTNNNKYFKFGNVCRISMTHSPCELINCSRSLFSKKIAYSKRK